MYDINASPRSGYHLPRPHSQQQQQHHHRFSPSESAQSMRFSGSSGSPSPYYPPSTPPSNMMALMGNPAAYPESRVYGRTKDLRKLADFRTPAPPTTPTTAAASSSSSSSSSSSDHLAASTPSPQEGPSSFGFSLGSKTGRPEPVFSVEVYANAFDERGYPIYAGKAANLAANVRLHPSLNADIQVTTYAYTTAGASAAVWDGVVLLPSASQSDRTIFKVKDRPSPVQEDYVLTVPLRWNLPIGASRAIVDGQSQTVHVSLPPSFEVTRADERDQQQMEAHAAAIGLSSSSSGSSLAPSSIYHGSPPGSSAGTTIGAPTITTLTPKKSKARTVRGMVERSLESVTRLGCFYAMDFALIARDSSSSSTTTTTAATPPSKSEKSEKSSKKGSDKNGVAKERIIDV
ncbi:unnamed protein product [Tilletia laevis]|nr:unnamed protein product [Tilletia laevis]